MLVAHSRLPSCRRTKALPRRCVVTCAGVKAPIDVSAAKRDLLDVISRTARGLSTSPNDLRAIQDAVSILRQAGKGAETTGAIQSGTWELAWTSEKETLFILERAPLFGTNAGGVYQVIDVGTTSSTTTDTEPRKASAPSTASTSSTAGGYLQNVITFPPEGAFIVDSSLQVAGPQRVAFAFTAAKLKLPGGRSLGLPPFGKGWFDNLYVDEQLRVSFDSRGDTLITLRAGPPRRFT